MKGADEKRKPGKHWKRGKRVEEKGGGREKERQKQVRGRLLEKNR